MQILLYLFLKLLELFQDNFSDLDICLSPIHVFERAMKVPFVLHHEVEERNNDGVTFITDGGNQTRAVPLNCLLNKHEDLSRVLPVRNTINLVLFPVVDGEIFHLSN